jgi:hypothetical protein
MQNPGQPDVGADTLIDLTTPFMLQVRAGHIEVYNEFSLQHELGIFLRQSLPNYRVRFERNVSYFFPGKNSFIKREIDITITSADNQELNWAIELKFPRNGQHPEQMFSFCKDIVFVEQLREAGFRKAGLLVFAEDPLFWRGSTEGIYGYFRGDRPLNGPVRKPTGAKDVEINICGNYALRWAQIRDSLQYLAVDATGKSDHIHPSTGIVE